MEEEMFVLFCSKVFCHTAHNSKGQSDARNGMSTLRSLGYFWKKEM